MFLMIIAVSALNSCDKELDIKTDFPFELKIMPVPKNIGNGETIEIRCAIEAEGNYQATKYFIRYFQFDGEGKLLLANGKMFTLKPNNTYILPEQIFRMYYISESIVSQSFDVWVSDDWGHEQKVSFQFNASDK
ncbi:conjugal transfer protein TraQ [Chryseobacterium sp. IHB B 17019]|nr:conjugal transfer protein TraQ [Chryseobacterium sp. IHB B 17019]